MSNKLGGLLVGEGLISPGQLKTALEFQKDHGGKIGECLVRLGFITEHSILATLAMKYQLPMVDLARVAIDEQVAHLLPMPFAHRHRCIPISRVKSKLTVAMADPVDSSVIDLIRFITGYHIEPALSATSDIVNAIARVYTRQTSSKDTGEINELVTIDHWTVHYPELTHEGGGGSPPAPAPFSVPFVNSILKNAIRRRASEIHIEPHCELFRVRFRIDGMLETVCEWRYPSFGTRERAAYSSISRFRRLAGITTTPALPAEGRIRVVLRTPAQERRITFELSSLPTLWGEKIVLRPVQEEEERVGKLDTELSSTELYPGWSTERKELAFIAAAQRGHISVLRALLSSGVNVDARRHGVTALMAAAQKGQPEIVRELLERGADASADCSGMTALQMAAFNGHVETVRAFLDQGNADLSICIDQVLSRAAMEGNGALIRLLVERQVADAYRALCVACEYAQTEITQWLLTQGAVDVTKTVELVARWGDAKALQMLLEHEESKFIAACLTPAIEILIEGWTVAALLWHPTIRSLMKGGIPLGDIVRRITSSYIDTLKLLLKAGAEVKAVDPACVASLARTRGGRLLRVLLEAGFQIPAELQHNMLLFAIQTADVDTVRALLRAHVPVGAEALRWMMGDDRREILQLARDQEDIDWKEDEKDQALMWAEYYGHVDIAHQLRKAGATLPEHLCSTFDRRIK